MGTIVVGVDGSEFAQFALRWSLGEARVHGHKILAVHAWDVPGILAVSGPGVAPLHIDHEHVERLAREALEAAVAQALRDAPEGSEVEIETRAVRDDTPANALIEAARSESAEHIVVGTRGHGGLRERLLGSTSIALTHHAPVPTTIVPPPDRDR